MSYVGSCKHRTLLLGHITLDLSGQTAQPQPSLRRGRAWPGPVEVPAVLAVLPAVLLPAKYPPGQPTRPASRLCDAVCLPGRPAALAVPVSQWREECSAAAQHRSRRRNAGPAVGPPWAQPRRRRVERATFSVRASRASLASQDPRPRRGIAGPSQGGLAADRYQSRAAKAANATAPLPRRRRAEF